MVIVNAEEDTRSFAELWEEACKTEIMEGELLKCSEIERSVAEANKTARQVLRLLVTDPNDLGNWKIRENWMKVLDRMKQKNDECM